jgi:hypothetical protein
MEDRVDETASRHRLTDPENIDALGVKVLAFIVADVDRIIQFLNITGFQPETIRQSA